MTADRWTRRTCFSSPARLAGCVLALGLLVAAPCAYASHPPDPAKVERKVVKKLESFKKGALVHVLFHDGSDSTGTLGRLDDHSFTLVNVESNATETHRYLDVDTIGKGSDEIGQHGRHHHGIL